jgi:hypothetical protein
LTVAGQGDDCAGQAIEGRIGAGRPAAAVPAADVGGDVSADEAEHGGERDEPGIGPRFRGGAGGGGGHDVVDEQERPGFLAGEVRGLAAQGAAGAADCLLQVEKSNFSRPLLIPVKKKSSLAFRVHPGRY